MVCCCIWRAGGGGGVTCGMIFNTRIKRETLELFYWFFNVRVVVKVRHFCQMSWWEMNVSCVPIIGMAQTRLAGWLAGSCDDDRFRVCCACWLDFLISYLLIVLVFSCRCLSAGGRIVASTRKRRNNSTNNNNDNNHHASNSHGRIIPFFCVCFTYLFVFGHIFFVCLFFGWRPGRKCGKARTWRFCPYVLQSGKWAYYLACCCLV